MSDNKFRVRGSNKHGESIPEKHHFSVDGYVMVDTKAGNILIHENEQGKVSVVYCDHVEMSIDGKVNDNPEITVDSCEYPTRLRLLDTESAFELSEVDLDG